MEEGTIAKWHKKVGDFVKAGELLIEVATDKATVEYNALDEGYLRQILVPEKKGALVNQPIAIFTVKKEESIEGYQPEGLAPAAPVAAPSPLPAAPTPAVKTSFEQPAFLPEPPLKNYRFEEPSSEIKASPLAKKLALEKGIDLSTVRGSGPGGRVVAADVDLGQPDLPVTFGRNAKPTVAPGAYTEIPLTPMRKAIGTRLQQSKSFIPHFYLTMSIDAVPMTELREELKNGGIKVTINDFILRASALTLREHPEVNAGFNSVTQSIIRFESIDISIAVSVDSGLITPIIRFADYKDLGALSSEVRVLASKAKAGKLKKEEYQGGSFTLSNLGMFGISEFIAVINPPQAAILAIAAIQEVPVVKNGTVIPGKTLNLTLSADHRVIDGIDGAKFLQTLKKYLEHPSLLLI
jgi:pyruvate dehydrogenase E2 component (dihydrolipoamide acetyltransferase)